jgi:hypothetical protein
MAIIATRPQAERRATARVCRRGGLICVAGGSFFRGHRGDAEAADICL